MLNAQDRGMHCNPIKLSNISTESLLNIDADGHVVATVTRAMEEK